MMKFSPPFPDQNPSLTGPDYVFKMIAEGNGWFTSGVWNDIFREVAGELGVEEELNPAGKESRKISGKVTVILDYLTAADTRSPDSEPSPIESPVVDIIRKDLHEKVIIKALQRNLPFIYKMNWPEGKPFALAVSHDVDLTRKFGIKSLLRDLAQFQMDDLSRHFQQSVFKKNVYWNFEDLLQMHRQRGIKSTFFFLARSWEKLNYRYNIRQNKFGHLFRQIITAGHEIGLHTSRYAFDHPQRIFREKRKLEEATGCTVLGVRQHYLRLILPSAWDYFEKAGFEYDSSSGYNLALGFRSGTCFPFPTWDQVKGRPRALHEIPFQIMDYPWLEAGESANLTVMGLIDRVKQQEGLLTILWHPSNLAEPAYRPLWENLWKRLETKEYHNDTLGNLVQWQKRRCAVEMSSLRLKQEGIEFDLTGPQTIRGLALGIVSIRRLRQTEGLDPIPGEVGYCYRLILPDAERAARHVYLPYQ